MGIGARCKFADRSEVDHEGRSADRRCCSHDKCAFDIERSICSAPAVAPFALSRHTPMKSFHVLPLSSLLAVTLHTAHASLQLASPFSDHAVLQRDIPVPVWGWDDQPGATITVAFGGQTKQTLVNAAGVWRVDLEPLAAVATGADLVVTGSSAITLHDIVVGEVWLASGQSNMEWAMHDTRGYAAEQALPANPLIRHLRIDHLGADLPGTRAPNGGWKSAGADTLGTFSGVGYFFAKLLSEKLQVPVGIIHSSWGGTPIESWIPEPVLRVSRSWPAFSTEWQAALKVYPEKYAQQPALEAAWQKAQADFKATGKPVTMSWPRPPMGPGSAYRPAGLYNAMIAPLAPYALRGALWYQGESNVGRHDDYAELLPAMIHAWRALWPEGDFPFLVVQLPNFSDNHKATGRAWAQLREAQAAALKFPAVGMAVTIDNDEPDNLHPTNKRPVGERLARIALHFIHDDPELVWRGPEFQSLEREGLALRVRFSAADGLKSSAPAVGGFEVAGADQQFHAAQAMIEGTAVIVRSPEVSDPVAVRYAYTNAPTATLVNAEGLPAAPFRTDHW